MTHEKLHRGQVGRHGSGTSTPGVEPGKRTLTEGLLAPAKSPVPDVAADKQAVPVDTSHAPSVEDVFDPQRPALDGASQDVVLKVIEGLVEDMYAQILDPQLNDLKKDLAKTKPPEETPFALKLLGWVVEQITVGTLSFVGKTLGKELFGQPPAVETTIAGPVIQGAVKPSAPSAKEAEFGKQSDKLAGLGGGALKERVTRPMQAPSADEVLPALTTGSLLDEFIVRERHMLYARKSDIMARLMLTHAAAQGKASTEFVALANKLRNVIGSGQLTNWFRNKVTMEWLNFVARVTVGPRAEGQRTDLGGANSIEGVSPAQYQQWVGSSGMIDITLDVPETVNGTEGLSMRRATTSYGAAQILHRMRGLGTDGKPYSLASMPVYRRVWLKTGESKLSESPAFVITPDGELEIDTGNAVLAAIGSGQPTEVDETTYGGVGTDYFTDERRQNPNEWIRRTATWNHGVTGAQRIRDMLQGVTPQVIQ